MQSLKIVAATMFFAAIPVAGAADDANKNVTGHMPTMVATNGCVYQAESSAANAAWRNVGNNGARNCAKVVFMAKNVKPTPQIKPAFLIGVYR